MLLKTQGIILKSIDYSETSIILKIFTQDFGLLSFLVKGAKSSKKNNYGTLRPMSILNISFYKKNTTTIYFLNSYELLFAPDSINVGIRKSSIFFFMIEILSKTIKHENETDTNKYIFVIDSINKIIEIEPNSSIYLTFFAKYLYFLGYDFSSLDLKTNEEVYFNKLVENDNFSDLKFNIFQRKKIYNYIEQQYKECLMSFDSIQSIEVINEIFQ